MNALEHKTAVSLDKWKWSSPAENYNALYNTMYIIAFKVHILKAIYQYLCLEIEKEECLHNKQVL